MDIRIVTLFPEMVVAATRFGVCGRALQRNLFSLGTDNPREYAADAHRTVDDRPYGGGPGMVLKVEPFRATVQAARGKLPDGSPMIFLSPQGRRFDQHIAQELAALPGMGLVAGRYEGFDERLIEAEADDEISLGDFVLSGGEIAAVAIIDAIVRLRPGALGDEASAAADSFSDSLLEGPHYTRPETVDGMEVPQVLLGGDYEEIRRWRLKQALGRTCARRPDLLANRRLTGEEQRLLQEYLAESQQARRSLNEQNG